MEPKMVAIITEKFKLHNASQFVEFSLKLLPIISSLESPAFTRMMGQEPVILLPPPDSVSDEFYFGPNDWCEEIGSSDVFKLFQEETGQMEPRLDV